MLYGISGHNSSSIRKDGPSDEALNHFSLRISEVEPYKREARFVSIEDCFITSDLGGCILSGSRFVRIVEEKLIAVQVLDYQKSIAP